MGLLSWFRRPTPPLQFATQVGEVRPLEAIPLETIQRAQRAYEEAVALDAGGDERAGIEKYSEAIALVPEFWEALDNRGMSRIRFGEFAEAIPDFERSAQLNPESPSGAGGPDQVLPGDTPVAQGGPGHPALLAEVAEQVAVPRLGRANPPAQLAATALTVALLLPNTARSAA